MMTVTELVHVLVAWQLTFAAAWFNLVTAPFDTRIMYAQTWSISRCRAEDAPLQHSNAMIFNERQPVDTNSMGGCVQRRCPV